MNYYSRRLGCLGRFEILQQAQNDNLKVFCFLTKLYIIIYNS